MHFNMIMAVMESNGFVHFLMAYFDGLFMIDSWAATVKFARDTRWLLMYIFSPFIGG